MAWIPCDTCLWEKGKVARIARRLMPTPSHPFNILLISGACLRVWAWVDANTETGRFQGVTTADLDFQAWLPGLADAWIEVGWLVVEDDGLVFPNFDRYNGNTSKARLNGAKRSAKFRRKQPPQQELSA